MSNDQSNLLQQPQDNEHDCHDEQDMDEVANDGSKAEVPEEPADDEQYDNDPNDVLHFVEILRWKNGLSMLPILVKGIALGHFRG